MHVGMRGVHEARHLRIAPGEIDLDVAAALGDLRSDLDVVVAAAVIVEEGFAMERAVLPGRDHGTRLRLGGIEHRLDRGFDGRRAKLGKEFLQATLAEMRGADHGREVAAEVVGIAHVERDHVEDVVAQPACLVELDRRDAQAFLPDLGGIRIVGAMRRTADVALMRAHHGPEQPAAAGEHRHEGSDVGQMAAAVIGIVHQDDVAGRDVLEALLHRARRPGQRADVDRDVIGLRDQPALHVADRQREIAAGIEDLRIGGAQHRLAHLGHDRAQPMLDDGTRDGIDGSGHVSPGRGRWRSVFLLGFLRSSFLRRLHRLRLLRRFYHGALVGVRRILR